MRALLVLLVAVAWPSKCARGALLDGDLTYDGHVDSTDLKALTRMWLGDHVGLADLNGDHRCTEHDFAALAANWRTHGQPPLIVEKASVDNDGRHFTSLQEAVAHAEPGDTILVKGGTYHEAVAIDKEGLTIRAFDPTRPPVITGADGGLKNPVWTHVQGSVYKTGYTWYKPQLTPDEFNSGEGDGGKSGNRIAMQVYEDEVLLRGYVGGLDADFNPGHGAPYSRIEQLDPMSESFTLPAHYKQEIRIAGRFFYDEAHSDLYVWTARGDNPDNHIYSIPAVQNLIRIQAPDVTIRDLVLRNSAGYALVVENGAHGAEIRGCFFINDMYAIYVQRAEDVVIAENFIQQKGMWERYWYGDCKHTVLWAHSIDLLSGEESGHTEICRNVIHGNYSALKARSNTDIHHNIMSHCMSTHINFACTSADVRIYRNILHHVDDNSLGTSRVFAGPIWVFRNLFYRCRAMNKAGTDVSDQAPGKCYFYHNTLGFGAMIAHHPYAYPVYGNHVYRNNIFQLKYLTSFERYWEYLGKDPSKGWSFSPFQNGPDSDYNLYWETDPHDGQEGIAYFSYEGEPREAYTFHSFAAMQEATGLDPHGLQADPMFRGKEQLDSENVTGAGYDTLSAMSYEDVIDGGLFHLFDAEFDRLFGLFAIDENSPAIDRGVRLSPDWPDIINPWPPDVGAWESGGLSPDNWAFSPTQLTVGRDLTVQRDSQRRGYYADGVARRAEGESLGSKVSAASDR